MYIYIYIYIYFSVTNFPVTQIVKTSPGNIFAFKISF